MTYLYALNFLYLLIKVVGFTFGAERPVAYRVRCSTMVFRLAVLVMKVVACTYINPFLKFTEV